MALFLAVGIFGEVLHATLGVGENKVMAGGTPANPAALARQIRLADGHKSPAY
jgi:hypothetical protein